MNNNRIIKTSIIILCFIILIGINSKCFAEGLNVPFLLDTSNSQNIDEDKVWEEKGNEIKQTYENIERDVNNKLFSDSNKVSLIFVIVIISVVALIAIGIILNTLVGKRRYKKYLVHYNDEQDNDRIDISSTGKFEETENTDEPKDEIRENEQTGNTENNQQINIENNQTTININNNSNINNYNNQNEDNK